MNRLLREMLADPDAVFEFSSDLPSGNTMRGTVGPIINGRIMTRIKFDQDPPSETDKQWAVAAMNGVMGMEAAIVSTAIGDEAADAKAREFLGGGLG